MVSKNLTPEGQRKKWYDPRKETLAKKSFELVRLCQSKVALFIEPYGENEMFVFKSHADFPEAYSVANVEIKTLGDFTPSRHLQALLQQRASDPHTHNASVENMDVDPRLSGQSQLDAYHAPDSASDLRTPLPIERSHRMIQATPSPFESTINPTEEPVRNGEPPRESFEPIGVPSTTTEVPRGTQGAPRPLTLNLGSNSLQQSSVRLSTSELSPTLFVSPRTPLTPRRGARRSKSSVQGLPKSPNRRRQKNRSAVGGLRPRV
ncbi:hypothetical protein L207DRAFT_632110 [Hyaloscypha variabilis F]|uniref:MADS-box domain-containing protein n=1 Tax=Hyaloscypha variabilis (strain UAMH 11265 / GT02V1 / F) TaxID=1149755 RepID=A0A2J6RUW9_HYAVF|nr:hypothetical protein L207DRAFT_632110 [Hyaloscypha variabilis F]